MKKYDRKEARKIAKIVNQAPRKKIYGDSRDALFQENGSVPCTMPPRTRPGKTYAGGRRLRRALTRLESNRKGTLAARSNQGKSGKRSLGDNAYQMPGSMNP